MKEIDFERYLQDRHAAQYVGLDDGMPDDYEYWLQELDIDEIITFANQYAGKVYNELS